MDASVPVREAMVGLGMSGGPIVAWPTEPNLHYAITPEFSIWLTAGRYQEGEVLDLEQVKHPVEIVFPPGITSMTAVLHGRHNWTVEPT